MKKKALRILALALSLAMIFAMAAACGNGDQPPAEQPPAAVDPPPAPVDPPPVPDADPPPVDSAEPVTISYMFWGDESEIANVTGLMDQFNAEHPGIRVVPEPVDRAEIESILTTRAASGTLPDTGFLTEQMTLDWAQAGFLGSPEGMYNEPVLDIITYKWQGQPVAYSSANEILSIYYNVDKFDAAGVDYPPATAATAWSWDEFVDAAKSLTFDANGRSAHDAGFDKNNVEQYGVYIDAAPWMLESFAVANGGGFFDANNWQNIIIDQPESTEAIQRWADLHLVHGVMPQFGTLEPTIEGVLLDHAAMMVNGQWSIGVWLAGAVEDAGLNYDVGVLPKMDQGTVSTATGGLAVMYEGTPHPEEAMTWLAWYAASSFELVYIGIWMPIFESWYTDAAKIADWTHRGIHPPSYKTAVIDYTLTNARPTFWYWVPGADPFLNVLGSALAPVWSGEQTAADAISAAMPAFRQAVGI